MRQGAGLVWKGEAEGRLGNEEFKQAFWIQSLILNHYSTHIFLISQEVKPKVKQESK